MEEREKCPFCGEIMEQGFLISARGIYWNKSIPSWLAEGEMIAHSARTWQWGCPHLPAFRCKKCKIILIQAPEMIIKPTKRELDNNTQKLYEQLLHIYMDIYGGGKRVLEFKIESLMKQGLSQEEAIRKLAEKEKLIEKE